MARSDGFEDIVSDIVSHCMPKKRAKNPAPRVGTARPRKKRLPNPKRRTPAARKQNPTVERISHCVLQTHMAAQEAVCFTRSGEYARIIAGLMQKHAAPGVTFTVVEA